MRDALCRLTVHAAGPDEPTAVDLVVPADLPLGELVPSIVDAVVGGSAPPRDWHLTRVAGATLDTSISLRDNAVRDGDMIALTSAPYARPRRLPSVSCQVVARAAEVGSSAPNRGVALAAGLACAMASAAALIWSALTTAPEWPLWTAAVVCATAATGSVAVGRTDRQLFCLVNTVAIVFGMATGVLAVPGATWQHTMLLAAAVAFAMSMFSMRVAAGDGISTALTASTGAVAASAALSVAISAQPAVAGAAMAVVSLAALSVAPKLTIMAAGLAPSHHSVDERLAAAAHRRLTGLVAGWSASAAFGAVVVAAVAVSAGSSPALAAAFTADLGMVLLLRQRSHADPMRRISLTTAGFISMFSAALVVVVTAPSHAFWLCAATAAACGAWLRWPSRSDEANPTVRAGIQALEYLALTAVIPLACWVSGLYGLVRGLSLP